MLLLKRQQNGNLLLGSERKSRLFILGTGPGRPRAP